MIFPIGMLQISSHYFIWGKRVRRPAVVQETKTKAYFLVLLETTKQQKSYQDRSLNVEGKEVTPNCFRSRRQV